MPNKPDCLKPRSLPTGKAMQQTSLASSICSSMLERLAGLTASGMTRAAPVRHCALLSEAHHFPCNRVYIVGPRTAASGGQEDTAKRGGGTGAECHPHTVIMPANACTCMYERGVYMKECSREECQHTPGSFFRQGFCKPPWHLSPDRRLTFFTRVTCPVILCTYSSLTVTTLVLTVCVTLAALVRGAALCTVTNELNRNHHNTI